MQTRISLASWSRKTIRSDVIGAEQSSAVTERQSRSTQTPWNTLIFHIVESQKNQDAEADLITMTDRLGLLLPSEMSDAQREQHNAFTQYTKAKYDGMSVLDLPG